MSRKQLFRQSNNQTVAEIFERFVASQTAKGVSDKTIQNYYSHLHSLKKHLDFSAPLATLTKEDLDNMVISMRQSGLAHNSISSYLRVFRTFLNWARKAGYETETNDRRIAPAGDAPVLPAAQRTGSGRRAGRSGRNRGYRACGKYSRGSDHRRTCGGSCNFDAGGQCKRIFLFFRRNGK